MPAERPISHSTAALFFFLFFLNAPSLFLATAMLTTMLPLSSDGCRYLIRAGELVSLVHSHDPRKVPNDEQDICQFINRQKSVARMIFQVDEWASK